MSYSQAWLEDPRSIRSIFVIVSRYNVSTTSEETLYLSTTGYVTTNADVSFDPILTGGVSLNESLSVDGGLSFSFGDIEISNPNGDLDTWVSDSSYVWVNRPIKIYYGDPQWNTTNITSFETDFLKIFDGLVANIDSRNRTTLNIKVRDKMERLNAPLTENKLGTYGTWGAGTQPNKDTIRPLVFGEVFNIEPLLVDPSLLKYMFNDGTTAASELVIEIRDNGVPIYTAPGITAGLTTGATIDLTNGTFVLAHPLAGGITASIQGVKNSINLSTGALVTGTYDNNIANLIALITTQYGKSYTKLTASDLDLTNLSTFAAANTQAVGISISGGENVLTVCQQLADSIGAQLYFNRVGKLQLLRLGAGFTGSSVTTITDSDILLNSLSISSKLNVVAASKIGYVKAWVVQEGLVTGIPDEHKLMFATEWYTRTATNSTAQSLYKLHVDPQQKDTMLLVGADADSEASRLKNYYSSPKTIYKMTCTSNMLGLELGQNITLIHNRFGLYNGGSGRAGQIYSLSPNWLAGTVEVEVII